MVTFEICTSFFIASVWNKSMTENVQKNGHWIIIIMVTKWVILFHFPFTKWCDAPPIFITDLIHCNWMEWNGMKQKIASAATIGAYFDCSCSTTKKGTIIYIRMDIKSSLEPREWEKKRGRPLKKCRNFSTNLAPFIAHLPLFKLIVSKMFCSHNFCDILHWIIK